MKSKTANWFETVIRYDKMQEDGMTKKVNEYYVVEAFSFGDAEEKITEEMSSYISGEFEVRNITPSTYHEIFFITFDEKTEKEKRTSVTYLVQASTLNGAVKNIEEAMAGTMSDYVISNISETKFLDVYEKKA